MRIKEIFDIVLPAIPETLIMIFVSALIAFIIGLPWAIITYMTRPDGLKPNKVVYAISNGLINIFRSLPAIILIIILAPLSRIIIGKAIGTAAAIVPLTFAAAPFVARLFEGYFLEVEPGIIEAAKSMGANNTEIIKVILKETFPQRILGITMTIINLVGYSAMAGVLGGGGLGDIAIRYGYQRNQIDVLWCSVLIIVIIVQLVQFIGNSLYKITNKK